MEFNTIYFENYGNIFYSQRERERKREGAIESAIERYV